jgi:hypothetical protein
MKYCWAPVTHVCNPSYSEGRDQEDHCSRLLQIVCKTLSRKNPSQKRAGRVAHSVGPEFKPQYCKKKKREENTSFKSFIETAKKGGPIDFSLNNWMLIMQCVLLLMQNV